jgi:hypothetical protein
MVRARGRIQARRRRTRIRVQPDLDERVRESRLGRYLLADEHPILAQHQHWAALTLPIAIGVAGLFVLVLLALFLPAGLDVLNPFLLLVWILGFGGWFLWKWFLWKRKWLLATDKRLLVNYGLIRQGISMISLARVVDLTYTRTTLGQVLGYGTLERESQKAPHSLHEVRWVRNPDRTYLTICAAIFDLQDRMFGMEEVEHQDRIDDVPPPGAPRPYAGNVSPGERPEPAGSTDEDIDSAGIQIHYGVSRDYDRDPWHLSADLREPSVRDADTGPIPYRPSATDDGEWRSTTNEPPKERKRETHPDRDQDHGREHDRNRDHGRGHDHEHDQDDDHR